MPDEGTRKEQMYEIDTHPKPVYVAKVERQIKSRS